MTTKYHDRFAAALRAKLPEGFEVVADSWHCGARLNGALLSAWMPSGDKRKPVTDADVSEWIDRAKARLRSDMYHYTPEAKEKGAALLAALAEKEAVET